MTGNVFISYASADQQTADRLVGRIEQRGIRCWISSRDIRAGEDYQSAIVAGLEASAVVLLLFSRHANASTEIPRELGLASRLKKTVIPTRLEDIVPSGSFAYLMTTAQFVDLSHDFESKVDDLCVRLAELLESSDEVRVGIAREQRRRKQRRTLGRLALGSLIAVVLAATLWLLRGTIEGWLTSRPNPASSTALAAAPPPAPPQVQNNSAPPMTHPTALAATVNDATAASPPAAPVPPAANGVLASRTYDGIRFDVMRVWRDGDKLKVLVTATETQKRDAKLQFFAPNTNVPQVIDDRGDTSNGFKVTGIPSCAFYLNDCSQQNGQFWAKLYLNDPLTMVLQFSGPAAFSGSSASLSFYVLLSVKPADGGPQQTISIPVAFTNLPLKPGAVGLSSQANRTYDGVRFDVMRVWRDGDKLKVLVTATETQKRDAKLQFFAPNTNVPQVIDDRGDTSNGFKVTGIPSCAFYLNDCSQQNGQFWAKLYLNDPLTMVLQFSGPAAFSGSSASLSFYVLLSVKPADASSPSAKVISVSFDGIPLK